MDETARATIRALVKHAYEKGWTDACSDHRAQAAEPGYPIGQGRDDFVDDTLTYLDPRNLLGLRKPGG